jgi:aminopeptidase YwaD
MKYFIKNFLLLLIILFYIPLNGQDIQYARMLLKQLTSEEFAGRNVADSGIFKAAKFIEDQLQSNGIMPLAQLNNSYRQCFPMPASLLIKEVNVKLDGRELQLGKEYLALPTAKSVQGDFDIKYIPINNKTNPEKIIKKITKAPNYFYFLDYSKAYLLKAKNKENYNKLKRVHYLSEPSPRGYILLDSSSFYYTAKSFSNLNHQIIVLNAKKLQFKKPPQKINTKYSVSTQPNTEICNIIGYIPGKIYPDSFIVIGAHYDHLGKVAVQHFPGANDNASGVAMLLDLSREFARSDIKPDYSLIFISFAGEEIGLLGSKYFTVYSPIELKKIKLMINLDMVGSGKEGIYVVNAKANPTIFQKLQEINDEKKYVTDMRAGGSSCSSDHCPFDQLGIPAIFIFSRDKDYPYYHIPDDDYDKLPLDGYEGIFKLIYDYIMQLNK